MILDQGGGGGGGGSSSSKWSARRLNHRSSYFRNRQQWKRMSSSHLSLYHPSVLSGCLWPICSCHWPENELCPPPAAVHGAEPLTLPPT